ncbi:MAG TPA: hypothetical protein VF258_05155 [Luteolibacter sp.]
MKLFTIITTLVFFVGGTSAVCNSLFVVFVGLILGPILLSPLLVTLFMSKFLTGNGTQITLLVSTVSYFSYFIYMFYFRPLSDGGFNFLALSYSVPIMIVLWFTAGFLSESRPNA